MRRGILLVSIAVVLLAGVWSYSRLRFKWHDGSIHVATVKSYENGTDTTYFLEIPLWPK